MIDDAYSIDEYFADGIADITMNRLKEYYLEVLLHLRSEHWPTIYKYFMMHRKSKFATEKPSSGILITTSDAYTLTDGPTIFLADDVAKIGLFYTQQSNIPTTVFQQIMTKIIRNNDVMEQIDQLESKITAKEAKAAGSGSATQADSTDKSSKSDKKNDRLCQESQAWMEQINKLRQEIRLVSLDSQYVPNSRQHQQVWSPSGEIHEDAFVSNIGEDMAKTIMMLNIDNNLKVLLLLGIGMLLDAASNVQYMEIMKKLADEQRLFIIVASTDYIYGTNYQFCHGFIGKDLTNMTQQKTLQAMGRIGRNNIQQDYTVRFRDDDMILGLFAKPAVNREADNMCRLFSSYA
jgi:ribosomal protein L19E